MRKTGFGDIACILFTLFTLVLCLPGCEPAMSLIERELALYAVEFNIRGSAVSEEKLSFFLDGGNPVGDLQVMVVNTGNRRLENLTLQKKIGSDANFTFTSLSTAVLEPEEIAAFTISFSASAELGEHRVEVKAGNDIANKILTLAYVLYNLTGDGLINIDPPFLQIGESDRSEAVIAGGSGGAAWVSSNEKAAALEREQNKLIAAGPGETLVYFPVDPGNDPWTINGKWVTVYPAVETLNPQYPQEKGVVACGAGGSVRLENLADIAAAAAKDGVIFFALSETGEEPNAVVSAVDPITGELTFKDGVEAGTAAETTVTLTITKAAVPAGTVTTHRGSFIFTAKIRGEEGEGGGN
jgi:hypothetical protein